MVLATIRCRSAQNDAQFLCASVELIFTIARDAASTSSCTRCWYDLTNDRHHLLLSPVHILQPTTLYSCCIITLCYRRLYRFNYDTYMHQVDKYTKNKPNVFLPRDAIRIKRGICCRPVSVRQSRCHVGVFCIQTAKDHGKFLSQP